MSEELSSEPTGDIASALHAAAADAGLDTNGDPVQTDSTDDGDDTGSTPAAPPAVPAKAEKTAAPATPEPAPAPQPDQKPKGPIPFARHEAILQSTREKVTAEVRASVDQELGPWRSVIASFKPEEFAPVANQLAMLARDPVQFYQALGQELQRTGQMPAQAPSPQRTMDTGGDREPEPDLMNPDTGELLYSAPQLQKAIAWREAKMEARMQATLAPLLQSHQRQTQEAELNTIRSRADQQAAEVISEAQSWEGFDELKPKIAALMKSDRRYSFEGAYRKVFQDEYLPGLKQREREAVVAELKTKGRAASSAVSPHSRSQASTGTGEMTFKEALEAQLTATGVSL